MRSCILFLEILLLSAINLSAKSDNGSIEGYIFNENKIPLSNVHIQAKPGTYSDISDSSGYFRLDDLTNDFYQLTIEHIGYQTKFLKKIQVNDNQITHLDSIILESKILIIDAMVVTAGRLKSDPPAIPNPINVITKKNISERSAKTSAEALREENGIFVQKTGHGGGSAIIRGLSSNQILILVDGIRLNNSLYRLGNHSYLTTIDNNSIQQIEVFRGPTSMQYGSDAMGGTINLRTQIPESQTSDFWSQFSLLSQYATADKEKTISGRTEFGFSRVSFNAGFSYKDFEDLRRGSNSDYARIEKSTNGMIQSPSGYHAYDFDSKLSYQISNGSDIIAAYQYSNQTNIPRYDKYENDNYYLWQYQPQRRQLVYLKYQHNLNSKYINSINSTISYNNQIEGRHIQRDEASELQKEKDEARTSGFTFEAKSYIGNQNLTYGTELYFDDIKSKRYSIDPITGFITKDLITRYPDGAEYNSYGFYIQDEYHINENWYTIFGSRYSYFDTQFQFPGIDTTNSLSGNRYNQVFKSLTFSAAIQHKLNDFINLNLTFGQAFRAPNLSDLSKFGESKGQVFEVPNPDIEPEKMYSADFGIKINYPKIKINSIVYYSKIADLLASADDEYNGMSTILKDSSIFIIKSKQNIGQAYIYGIESSFNYQFSNKWQIRGNTTWTYGQNTTLNEPIGGIPPLFGLLGVQFNQTKFKIETYMRFATKQDRLSDDDLDDPRIPNNGTPAWQTYNIRLKYKISNLINLQFALENILDYNYREHGSGINGPGRNIIISLLINN